ncbi:hypothetical protein K432DRAFT_377573 [Lepidopterella palustris CBS 459.81]|uniref:Uncharacterized protein n=1 Tax=Lepidopterella palustris CBS 459.81 TaxID=1314670 RepID=A0A8E2EKA0_9PEZI|nr:hypothetical protein K432DRAFT_377573 [Lepidopterella palustris CBS 459.81]
MLESRPSVRFLAITVGALAVLHPHLRTGSVHVPMVLEEGVVVFKKAIVAVPPTEL